MRHIRSAMGIALLAFSLGGGQPSSRASSSTVTADGSDVNSAIEKALAAGRADEAVAVVEQQLRQGAERRMKRVLAARKKLGQDSVVARLECMDATREFTRYLLDVSIATSVEEDTLDQR